MLAFLFTNQFKKDLTLMAKRHQDIDVILDVVASIIWEEPLPDRCRPHLLHGDLEGITDCHIKNDLVLLYHVAGQKVAFHAIGTHSDLKL